MISLAKNTIPDKTVLDLANWLTSFPRLTKGTLCDEFEKKFSNYIGCKHTILVNSGSSANLLVAYALLKAKNLRNKKVIVPSVSWITTLAPFLQLGFEVILCDCDRFDLGLDLNHFKKLIEIHDPAVAILVHVLGYPNKMDEITKICDKNKIYLLEDSCEALGSKYENTHVGNFGCGGTFSFYYGHHMSTIEGGAVVTNDDDFADAMKSIRSHGWSRDISDSAKEKWKSYHSIDDVRELYTFYFAGFNLRSNEISAYLGLKQLDDLPSFVEHRKLVCKWYKEDLPNFYYQKASSSIVSPFAYGILVKNRLDVFYELQKNGIESRPLICGSLGRQPFWINEFGETKHKNADIVHDYGLYLPIHNSINRKDVELISSIINQIGIPIFFE